MRNSSAPSRPVPKESSTDARSVISAEWLMSPKSMIPVMKPASSVKALSTVRSVWTICARSRGHTGAARRSNASSTRATTARTCRSRMSSSMARADRACWTSHSIVRCARPWVKPRRACARRAVVSPQATSAASGSSSASIRLFPGRTS